MPPSIKIGAASDWSLMMARNFTWDGAPKLAEVSENFVIFHRAKKMWIFPDYTMKEMKFNQYLGL